METASLILSIVASIGTITSLIINFNLKREIDSLKQQISGDSNIQSQGSHVINNTGDSSTFKR
ncbi:hypothetical protein [Radiobacillus deserti]|uniref:Uncharacterized protein n=1 Tax=Radiobacillus deserti TaxID=2594883 RepID=A0A516KDQ8_9BACI|nr:hypothetical protein [Radiobacillus deserti]QDP39446.1 hypothetical protein FN924_04195 [Radiobacillus deserti]